MTKYISPLNRKHMPKNVLSAYTSWCEQRRRCRSEEDKYFKYYRAKGLTVNYSSRDFINWWLQELSKNKLPLGTIVCERINHDKGYFFGNIKLGTHATNALESFDRNFGKLRKSVVLLNKRGEILRNFQSATEAARYAGVTTTTIVAQCKRRYKEAKSGLIFRYET